jgi:hypothetical protein
MLKLASFVAGCALLSACSREGHLNDVELPRPFALVSGVTPGTTLSGLEQRRPAARFEPYVGYKEQVGSVTFRYYVDGTESRQIHDPSGIRIGAVEAVVKHGAPEQAAAAWASAFREYQARVRSRPECYAIDGTIANNGPVALWKEDDAYVVLRAAQGYAGTARNPHRSPPLLIWRVGVGELPAVLSSPGAKQVDCAVLARSAKPA